MDDLFVLELERTAIAQAQRLQYEHPSIVNLLSILQRRTDRIAQLERERDELLLQNGILRGERSLTDRIEHELKAELDEYRVGRISEESVKAVAASVDSVRKTSIHTLLEAISNLHRERDEDRAAIRSFHDAYRGLISYSDVVMQHAPAIQRAMNPKGDL